MIYDASGSYFAPILDSIAASGNLRLGIKAGETSFYQPAATGFDDFISINSAADETIFYVNKQGVFVQNTLEISLAHEIAHKYYGASAADPTLTFVPASASFDFQGGAVLAQNTVAVDLNHPDLQQVSYRAYLTTDDDRFNDILTSHSYTDGDNISISILGTNSGEQIDISNPTDDPATLIFGFGGNDTIFANGGVDYLYGGVGNDIIDAGGGNDHVAGEAGDDSLVGGAGADTIAGGTLNGDSLSGGDGSDTISGGAGADLLISGGGVGDSLSGGDGADKLVAKGASATIDGGAGDDLLDATGNPTWEDWAIVRFALGSGHDYIVQGAYADETDPTVFYNKSNIATIDLSGLNISAASIVWNKTFVESITFTGEGGPFDTVDYYEGDLVLKLNENDTLYLGNFQGAYSHDQDIWQYNGDLPVTLHFDDGDVRSEDLPYIDPGALQVGSVSSYLHALDGSV